MSAAAAQPAPRFAAGAVRPTVTQGWGWPFTFNRHACSNGSV